LSEELPSSQEAPIQSEKTSAVSYDDLAEMEGLSEEDVEALIDKELAAFYIPEDGSKGMRI